MARFSNYLEMHFQSTYLELFSVYGGNSIVIYLFDWAYIASVFHFLTMQHAEEFTWKVRNVYSL